MTSDPIQEKAKEREIAEAEASQRREKDTSRSSHRERDREPRHREPEHRSSTSRNERRGSRGAREDSGPAEEDPRAKRIASDDGEFGLPPRKTARIEKRDRPDVEMRSPQVRPLSVSQLRWFNCLTAHLCRLTSRKARSSAHSLFTPANRFRSHSPTLVHCSYDAPHCPGSNRAHPYRFPIPARAGSRAAFSFPFSARYRRPLPLIQPSAFLTHDLAAPLITTSSLDSLAMADKKPPAAPPAAPLQPSRSRSHSRPGRHFDTSGAPASSAHDLPSSSALADLELIRSSSRKSQVERDYTYRGGGGLGKSNSRLSTMAGGGKVVVGREGKIEEDHAEEEREGGVVDEIGRASCRERVS